VLFTYCIVPIGGGPADALVRGNLLTATLETAKCYVRGVKAPSVKGRSDLEVILLHRHGKEMFRCFTGPAANGGPDTRVGAALYCPGGKRVRLSRP